MSHAIRRFLRDEKHASNVLIGGAAAVAAVCFLVAVSAIAFMK